MCVWLSWVESGWHKRRLGAGVYARYQQQHRKRSAVPPALCCVGLCIPKRTHPLLLTPASCLCCELAS